MEKLPLLLLHGALGSKAQFSVLKAKLSIDFEVFDFDFQGHGGRPVESPFTMDLFTDNVLSFLDDNDLGKVHVFGYSMGGYVALNTALKHPERISKITTLGTKFDWSLESAEKEIKMLNPEKVEEKVPGFAENLRQIHHPQDWKVIMRKTAEMMLGMGNGARLTDEDFAQINQQVVVGIGSMDRMVSFAESKHVAALLPNGRLVHLEGVQHPIEKIATDVLFNLGLLER